MEQAESSRPDPPARLAVWLARVPRIAAACGGIVGVLVLAGWSLDLAALKTLGLGSVEVKANTGAALLIAGVALWWSPGLGARVAAAVVAAIGIATLSQDLFGWDLGIDELLSADANAGKFAPGRMAVSTALGFALLGFALVLPRRTGGQRRGAEVAGAGAGLIALFTLLGHVFGLGVLSSGMAQYTMMAVATALALLALAIGTLAAVPDGWLVNRFSDPGPAGTLARRFLPAVLVLPVGLGWLRLVGERAGWYGAQVSVALIVVITVLLLLAAGLWSIAVVGCLESERRRADDDARAGEQGHRALFANMPDGFALCRMEFLDGRPVDFTFLDVNPAFERVTGLLDAVGRRVTEVIPRIRETNPELFEVYGRVARTGVPAEFKTYVAGLGVHFHISAYRPRPDHFVAVFADVTEQVRAEEALRGSEQRLLTLFETVNLIVLALDGQGRVDYVNPYFLRLTGYTRDEAVGSEWFRQFLPEAQRPPMLAVFREQIEHSLHPHYQSPILTKTGEERRISWHNTVMRGPDGRAEGTLSVGEDITERLALEDRLRQSQKMEAVGRLAGGVAHDFNNVLTAIFGYTDLLEADLPAGPAHEDIGEIRAAAARAAGLTRQLLAFSRRQVLQPVVLNLNDVVNSLKNMLRRLIGEDVELRSALSPDLGNASADPGQIEQVIVNLAVNARDAMPTGGRLTIETANADLSGEYVEAHQPVVPGRYVMLAVADSGVGMSPEIRGRIFEPFFTTKEKGKGTGLGLSTVYGIVKQSGGYIWVYSEPEHGATFKVYLPRVDAPVEAPAPPRPRVPAPAGTGTILVAEDDDLLRPLIRNILEVHGYKVLDAPNARAALARAREHAGDIHLLVTDVVMPGESGRQLARQLLDVRPTLRVLYVSGYTDDAIVHHGMLEPGLHYLQKPFTPAALVGKVRDVLEAQA
jgi:PAS domain S-box-containing protein